MKKISKRTLGIIYLAITLIITISLWWLFILYESDLYQSSAPATELELFLELGASFGVGFGLSLILVIFPLIPIINSIWMIVKNKK